MSQQNNKTPAFPGKKAPPPKLIPPSDSRIKKFNGRHPPHPRDVRRREQSKGKPKGKKEKLKTFRKSAVKHTRFDGTLGFQGEGPGQNTQTRKRSNRGVDKKFADPFSADMRNLVGADETPTIECAHDKSCTIAGHLHRFKRLPLSGFERRQAEKKEKRKSPKPADYKYVVCESVAPGACETRHYHTPVQLRSHATLLKGVTTGTTSQHDLIFDTPFGDDVKLAKTMKCITTKPERVGPPSGEMSLAQIDVFSMGFADDDVDSDESKHDDDFIVEDTGEEDLLLAQTPLIRSPREGTVVVHYEDESELEPTILTGLLCPQLVYRKDWSATAPSPMSYEDDSVCISESSAPDVDDAITMDLDTFCNSPTETTSSDPELMLYTAAEMTIMDNFDLKCAKMKTNSIVQCKETVDITIPHHKMTTQLPDCSSDSYMSQISRVIYHNGQSYTKGGLSWNNVVNLGIRILKATVMRSTHTEIIINSYDKRFHPEYETSDPSKREGAAFTSRSKWVAWTRGNMTKVTTYLHSIGFEACTTTNVFEHMLASLVTQPDLLRRQIISHDGESDPNLHSAMIATLCKTEGLREHHEEWASHAIVYEATLTACANQLYIRALKRQGAHAKVSVKPYFQKEGVLKVLPRPDSLSK
jgi:hypothetical protein